MFDDESSTREELIEELQMRRKLHLGLCNQVHKLAKLLELVEPKTESVEECHALSPENILLATQEELKLLHGRKLYTEGANRKDETHPYLTGIEQADAFLAYGHYLKSSYLLVKCGSDDRPEIRILGCNLERFYHFIRWTVARKMWGFLERGDGTIVGDRYLLRETRRLCRNILQQSCKRVPSLKDDCDRPWKKFDDNPDT